MRDITPAVLIPAPAQLQSSALEGELIPAGVTPYKAVQAYLGSLGSDRSKAVMRSTLTQIAQHMGYRLEDAPWDTLTRDWVITYITRLSSTTVPDTDRIYSPATVNRYLATLKGVAKEARYLKLISPDDYQGIKDVKRVRGSRLPRGRALEKSEAAQFLHTCTQDERVQGIRDRAIFALLFGSGMRRAEVVSLNIADIDWKQRSVTVRGKGNKERFVDMTNRAWGMLTPWLDVRGTESGPLFLRIRKNNELTKTRLTSQAIYYLIEQWSIKAGVPDVTPHDLRRSFITWMLEDGEDLGTVATMVGHANIQTTKQYDQRDRQFRQAKLREKDF